ncbi:hypothetical protein Hanom_Chr08g00736161 [Helianthus anomalus]
MTLSQKSVSNDNVFVNVVASIQYRALSDKASDAYYKLSNTRAQIQAYVFDGINLEQSQTTYQEFFFLFYFKSLYVVGRGAKRVVFAGWRFNTTRTRKFYTNQNPKIVSYI